MCCARRHGLIASITRIVAFRALSAAEEDRYTALLRVEQGFLDTTRAGVPVGAIVAAGVAGYAEHGFPADEWHRHHQGGFSGVQPRESPAHPGSTTEVPSAARSPGTRRRLEGRGHLAGHRGRRRTTRPQPPLAGCPRRWAPAARGARAARALT